MAIDLTEGCTHQSGKHLYNCHQVCQWCNWDKADIELIKLRARVRELEEGIKNHRAFCFRARSPLAADVELWAKIGPAQEVGDE